MGRFEVTRNSHEIKCIFMLAITIFYSHTRCNIIQYKKFFLVSHIYLAVTVFMRNSENIFDSECVAV